MTEGLDVSRSYSPKHELTSIGSNSQTYDNDGNLTADTRGQTLTLDVREKLTRVDGVNTNFGFNGSVEYAYAADGRRVVKRRIPTSGPVETTRYVYAGQHCVAEYVNTSPSAYPHNEYVYADHIDSMVLMRRNNTDYAVLRNQQTSVTALIRSSNNTVFERYAYGPYGQRTILHPNGSTVRALSYVDLHYGYTSRRHDIETDLMYFRARYYDPNTGEFISPDPMGMIDGPSLYRGYFGINGVDPFGNRCCSPDGEARENLDPQSWAAQALNEFDRIRSVPSGLGKVSEIPNMVFQGGKLFLGMGHVVSASFKTTRGNLNETAGDKRCSCSERCAATFLRYTLASEVNEVFVQGANSFGQSGPLLAIPGAPAVMSNRIIVKTTQLTASIQVADDCINRRFNSENIANAGLAFAGGELLFRRQVINRDGKIQITSWSKSGGASADLNKQRWVMIGAPSKTTYGLSGLRFGTLRPASPPTPFHRNFKTKWVNPADLAWPSGMNKFRGCFDQRILKVDSN